MQRRVGLLRICDVLLRCTPTSHDPCRCPPSVLQTCLLCTAILSSLLTAQHSAVEGIAIDGTAASHKKASTGVFLDVLITCSTFVVPALLMLTQVGP